MNKLKNNGNKYIVRWDANESHDSDTIMDLLQETEMVDAFLKFFQLVLLPTAKTHYRYTLFQSAWHFLRLLTMLSYSTQQTAEATTPLLASISTFNATPSQKLIHLTTKAKT
jgi:hypothetical protein